MHINCTEQDNLDQVVLSGIISVSEDTSCRSMANQFCVADQLPTSRPTKGFFQTSSMTVFTTGQQRMLPSDDVTCLLNVTNVSASTYQLLVIMLVNTCFG